MAKILFVEDNIQFADVLSKWLNTQGYVVDTAHNGEDAVHLISTLSYDLLLLDWELPGMQGIEVCDYYRKKGGKSPTLFLTGKNDTGSKVTGLETGADDYLTKPFEFPELLARIRSLLRRIHQPEAKVIKSSGMTLNLDNFSVELEGTTVSLTPREFALLEFLMKNKKHAFNSKTLLETVWPEDTTVSEDTVRSCMRSLRKKITVGDKPCAVKTIQGMGYVIET